MAIISPGLMFCFNMCFSCSLNGWCGSVSVSDAPMVVSPLAAGKLNGQNASRSSLPHKRNIQRGDNQHNRCDKGEAVKCLFMQGDKHVLHLLS
jgi:hypothetical protein